MTLIVLTGSKGSGKTTLGKYIEHEMGFTRIPMAKVLKDMLLAMGLTEDHINGDLKEAPCEMLCGRSPRYAMQTLGTEWGRLLIGQELWTNMWKQQVRKHAQVICDDIRYPNELTAAQELNAITINIRRSGTEGQDSHTSELYAQCMKTHIEINNDNTIEDMINIFKLKFDDIMKNPGRLHA